MLFFSSNKRVIFTFGFSFFFAFVAQAQVFSGQVVDPDKKSLPYTGLTLKRDSVKIAGGFTDSFGKFVFRRLTSGNYTLQVKSLLYETETISFYLDSAQRLNRVVQLNNKLCRDWKASDGCCFDHPQVKPGGNGVCLGPFVDAISRNLHVSRHVPARGPEVDDRTN
jgi:hypothetical protein